MQTARDEITPHVAQNNTNRRSAIDERTTRHAGYESVSETKAGGEVLRLDEDDRMLRKVKLRGLAKVGWLFTFTGAAYNLLRIPKFDGQNMMRSFDLGPVVD